MPKLATTQEVSTKEEAKSTTSRLLAKYRSAKIRHPSWRVYKAIQDIHKNIKQIKKQKLIDPEELDNLSPQTFGLKADIDVYIPYEENDDLTNEIIAAIINPEYSDTKKYGIDECMAIFCDIENKQLLEGMLMEGSMPGDIALELGYQTHTVETYASAFYDTSVWRSLGDKVTYLKTGIIGADSDAKNSIHRDGIDYVGATRYNRPRRVKMENVLMDVFGRAYREIVYGLQSSEPEAQANAQKWATQAIGIFKELKNASKGDGGIRELSIALHTDSAPTKGIEELD